MVVDIEPLLLLFELQERVQENQKKINSFVVYILAVNRTRLKLDECAIIFFNYPVLRQGH
jgi:hypothetical protein